LPDFRVSVVIPLHNKAPFIRRTLMSALAQDHAADEIIVVDDCSTDASMDAIRDLICGRVRLVQQSNAGPGPARNRGIEEASQPWIAFLDGDDVWRPEHLATLGEISRKFADADLVASGYEVARSDQCKVPLSPAAGATGGEVLDFFNEPAERSAIWTSCVAVTRSALLAVGGFGSFCPGEDRELWTRLALDRVFAVSKKCTAIYIQQTGGVMDVVGSRPMGFFLPPVYATLERAFNDPKYSDRHGDLLRHYRGLLKLNIRQSLYRGEAATARLYIREYEKSGRGRLGFLKPLSSLPASLLRAGMAARTRWRGRGASSH